MYNQQCLKKRKKNNMQEETKSKKTFFVCKCINVSDKQNI